MNTDSTGGARQNCDFEHCGASVARHVRRTGCCPGARVKKRSFLTRRPTRVKKACELRPVERRQCADFSATGGGWRSGAARRAWRRARASRVVGSSRPGRLQGAGRGGCRRAACEARTHLGRLRARRLLLQAQEHPLLTVELEEATDVARCSLFDLGGLPWSDLEDKPIRQVRRPGCTFVKVLLCVASQ